MKYLQNIIERNHENIKTPEEDNENLLKDISDLTNFKVVVDQAVFNKELDKYLEKSR